MATFFNGGVYSCYQLLFWRRLIFLWSLVRSAPTCTDRRRVSGVLDQISGRQTISIAEGLQGVYSTSERFRR